MAHRILVIDDESQVRKMLSNFLQRKLGYEVRTAASGREGLDLALEEAFDLCILDVNMPELSGAETLLRLQGVCPEIEVIFFTAVKDFETSQDFLRFSLPPERVITKPIADLAKFTRLIVGILGPPKP